MSVNKKKKKMSTGKKAVFFFFQVLLLVIVICAWYVVTKLDKYKVIEPDRDAIVVNPYVHEKNEAMKGFTNILLLGTDARENTLEAMMSPENGNTDAIIIASINNETKEIKMVSVYRDTLLMVPPGKSKYPNTFRKATEAFFYSGLEATMGMVNMNLDLDITEYVMVNFDALIRIVDAVGGIELEIDDNELYWLNEYLRDTGLNTGRTYENVPHSGYVHLDGIQATAYCRVRYDKNLDYGRAERQRKVIAQVFEKAKKMNFSQLNAAINGVLDNVVTSISFTDPLVVQMLQDVFNYNLVGQSGFPFEKFGSMKYVPEVDIHDPVFPVTLASNVVELHEYLFGVENYEPTDVIMQISSTLEKLYNKNYYPDNIYQ